MNRDEYPYYLIHIKTSGEVLRMKTDKQEPPLELLQRLVGGYIEAVPAKHGVLIVNDAGKLYPLAMNAVATEMLRSDIHDVICGDAVLVQADGERLIGFTKEQAQQIVNGLRKAVSV